LLEKDPLRSTADAPFCDDMLEFFPLLVDLALYNLNFSKVGVYSLSRDYVVFKSFGPILSGFST